MVISNDEWVPASNIEDEDENEDDFNLKLFVKNPDHVRQFYAVEVRAPFSVGAPHGQGAVF